MKIISIVIGICLFVRCGSGGCCECGDCPDEPDNGNFRLLREWKTWQGLTPPEETEVYFYHYEKAPFHYAVLQDVSYHDLPEGEYHILACNRNDLLNFQGMDSYLTAEAVLPELIADSIRMIPEVPALFIGNLKVNVTGKFTTAKIELKPAFKILNLKIEIVGNVPSDELISCEGYLTGVQTSLRLCTDQFASFYAPVSFGAKKGEDDNFYKSIYLFGLNKEISNRLSIRIKYKSGDEIRADADVTGIITFKNSPIENYTIRIITGGLDIGDYIEIEEWQPGVNGDIVLK